MDIESLSERFPRVRHPDWQARFRRLAGANSRAVVEILTDHLFLESRLNSLLDMILVERSRLFPDGARSDFSRKVDLLHALLGDRSLWDNLRLINKLRNELAHRMDGPAYEAAKAKIVEAAEKGVRLDRNDWSDVADEDLQGEREMLAFTTIVMRCEAGIERMIDSAKKVNFSDFF